MASLLVGALALLAPLALAQEGTILDAASLPQCAFSCGTLLSAQSLCVPPIAPPNGQGSYQTCFCNSNYLAPYKAGSASPVCDDVCVTTGERQQILQWYTGLCNGNLVVIPNPNVADAADPAATAGTTPTATPAVGAGSSQDSGPRKSWISTHYQWIIMIIILIFAGAGATWLGIWLKRRHDAKWATGGYSRDSMLRTHDVSSSLGNRHPDPARLASMSQVNIAGVQPQSVPGTSGRKGPSALSREVRNV